MVPTSPSGLSGPRLHCLWRRRRDSNPRDGGYPPNGFRDRRIQPLCHPSGWRRARDSNPGDGSTPPTRFPIVRLQPLGQLSVSHASTGRTTGEAQRQVYTALHYARNTNPRRRNAPGHVRAGGAGRLYELTLFTLWNATFGSLHHAILLRIEPLLPLPRRHP